MVVLRGLQQSLKLLLLLHPHRNQRLVLVLLGGDEGMDQLCKWGGLHSDGSCSVSQVFWGGHNRQADSGSLMVLFKATTEPKQTCFSAYFK